MSSSWIARVGACALVASAAIGVAGCTDGGEQSQPPGSPNGGGADQSSDNAAGGGGNQPSNSPDSQDGANQAQGLVRAGETAMDAVPDSTVISIETERNGARWEVQVVTPDGTEHELDVAGNGSEVVSGPTAEEEDQHDKAKHQRRVQAAELDYQQAAEKMLSTVSQSSKITELNLDSERGKTVWEADVYDSAQTKHEVTLDAGNGAVISDNTD